MSARRAIDSPVPHDLLPPWRRTRLAWLLIAVLVVAALGAAAPFAVPRRATEARDPLASLAAAQRSRRWDLGFWTGEQAAGTATWRGAVAYCRGRRQHDRPNCTTVGLASWWGPSPLPAWSGAAAAPSGAAPGAGTTSVVDAAPTAPTAALRPTAAPQPGPAPPAPPGDADAVRR